MSEKIESEAILKKDSVSHVNVETLEERAARLDSHLKTQERTSLIAGGVCIVGMAFLGYLIASGATSTETKTWAQTMFAVIIGGAVGFLFGSQAKKQSS